MYDPIFYNDEIFKDIDLPNIKPIYAISNYGKVLNKLTGKLLSIQITEDGYGRVSLYCINNKSQRFLVHRLVMMVFHPIENPSIYEVNHINGKKLDNRDTELEWCTPLENNHHAFRTGLNKNIAENHSKAVFSNNQVHEICKYLSEGKTVNEIIQLIGEVEGCHDLGRTIRAIRERKAWQSISNGYTFINYNNRNKFTTNEVKIICEMLSQGIGYKDILIRLGIDIDSLNNIELENYCNIISNIRMGKYYKNISKDFNFSEVDKSRYDQIFSETDIRRICKYLEDGLSYSEILAIFGITKETVSEEDYTRYKHFISTVKTRKVFTNISIDYKF